MIKNLTAWTTGHSINDAVMRAVAEGFNIPLKHIREFDRKNPVPSISYGILRGTGDMFKVCQAAGVPWFYLDHGYFNRSDNLTTLDGYFRLCLNGTRGKYIYEFINDERFVALGIEVKPYHKGDFNLLIDTSPFVREFMPNETAAFDQILGLLNSSKPFVKRSKASQTSLADELAVADTVCAFNSNVLIEALVAGCSIFPSQHDITFSWLESEHRNSRHKLFSCLANMQYTLKEYKEGKACHLLATLVGTLGKK